MVEVFANNNNRDTSDVDQTASDTFFCGSRIAYMPTNPNMSGSHRSWRSSVNTRLTELQTSIDAISGGQLGVVETVTLGSSGNTITHTFATGFDYFLKIEGVVPLTDQSYIYIRFNADSGSNYEFVGVGRDSGGTNRTDESGGTTQFILSDSVGVPIGNGTGEHYHADLRILNGPSTTLYKGLAGTFGYFAFNANEVTMTFSGTWRSAAALTSLFIGASGGTPHFSAGTATLYRMART